MSLKDLAVKNLLLEAYVRGQQVSRPINGYMHKRRGFYAGDFVGHALRRSFRDESIRVVWTEELC